MYSLLIDTHDTIIKIVLYKDGKVLTQSFKESLQSHSLYIMNTIKEIIENNNISKNDIAEILVVNGPGSFTGVRLGVTIAKGWAFCKKLKIKTLSVFEVLKSSLNDSSVTIAIKDSKGYYICTESNQYTYIPSNKITDYNNVCLESEIKIDYNKVYEYSKSLEALNPHAVNPLYIKKIGIGND